MDQVKTVFVACLLLSGCGGVGLDKFGLEELPVSDSGIAYDSGTTSDAATSVADATPDVMQDVSTTAPDSGAPPVIDSGLDATGPEDASLATTGSFQCGDAYCPATTFCDYASPSEGGAGTATCYAPPASCQWTTGLCDCLEEVWMCPNGHIQQCSIQNGNVRVDCVY